jgi:hypothetical protein
VISADGTEDIGAPVYGPSPIDKVVIKSNHPPAVFAIVSRTGEPWNPQFRLIDVGFSGTDGMVLADHARRAEWAAENDGALQVYLLDLKRHEGDPAARAQAIIEEYRERYDPPKGFISLAG